MPAGPCVVLVGMPGAGKTTVGRRVAYRLGVDFLDADDAIERRAGRTVREIFSTDGEAAFRAQEATVVAVVFDSFPGVFALGGGALLDQGTRTRLRALATSGTVVALLTASLPVLQQRVGDGTRRPLLAGDVRVRLAALVEERAALFAEVATLTVDTDGLDRQQVAARIARVVRARAAKTDRP
jgi:shikimate kinase